MSAIPEGVERSALGGPIYRRYVLVVLASVVGLNFVDRFLVTLLLQPIKQDLRLSDTQLGFLSGIAFGVFYAILGLPIARWADRGDRVSISSLAIGLWAITVSSCVFVTSFLQLAVIRVFAAVGEAGCLPPTYSLVGDYFPDPDERTRAMAVYWLSACVAAVFTFGVGGWLNDSYGWRYAFLAIAVPGILAAPLLKLSVVEPRLKASRPTVGRPPPPRLVDVLSILWRRRSLRHLSLATILLLSAGQGITPWYGAFLMRSHGMGTSELGLWLALIFGFSGTLGMLLGGYGSVRWSSSERARLRLTAVTVAAVLPGFVLFLLLPSKFGALLALVPLTVLFNFFVGPTFALMQRLVADDIRATTLAAVMLVANLVGMGLAPQIVGILSDALLPVLGTDSLRYAMLMVSLTSLWAAYHFWQVGETLCHDLSGLAN
jgi:predicted MFS family arabinose efflux permease